MGRVEPRSSEGARENLNARLSGLNRASRHRSSGRDVQIIADPIVRGLYEDDRFPVGRRPARRSRVDLRKLAAQKEVHFIDQAAIECFPSTSPPPSFSTLVIHAGPAP